MGKKYTPGPWFYQKGFNTVYSFYGETSGLTTCVSTTESKQLNNGSIECVANAKLISAAPDLLESLVFAMAKFDEVTRFLQNYILPDSKISDEEAINEIVGFMDNTEIVVEVRKAHAAIEKATT